MGGVDGVLRDLEDRRRNWLRSSDEHRERLERYIQLCKYYVELRELESSLNDLHVQVNRRVGHFGNAESSCQSFIEACKQDEKTSEVLRELFFNFYFKHHNIFNAAIFRCCL